MKNLHLLPTDKPSRLCFRNYYFINKDNITEYSNVNFKNIYITDDEEIKEGDWVYCLTENRVLISNVSYSKLDDRFKIILTTDKDLITDGVQHIDDEFLEWFVKNPSCEEVKVKRIFTPHEITQDDFCITCDSHGCKLYDEEKYIYKIIIPTEEPKALTKLEIAKNIASIGIGKKEEPKFGDSFGNLLNVMSTANFMFRVKEEPKQETLEEAAENYAESKSSKFSFRNTHIRDFTAGAKWQQKKMYSEEEVEALLLDCRSENPIDVSKWFEQFKKK